MRCPPFGLCVPVLFVRARDADTVEVRVAGTMLSWAIRLKAVWAPELRRGNERELAEAGKKFVADILSRETDIRLHVDFPDSRNVLSRLSFDRVPGTIFLANGKVNLNQLIIGAGFASSTKDGRIGE